LFTTVAYQSTAAIQATLFPMVPAPDQHVAISGNDIFVPDLHFLAGYYAQGLHMTRAQIISPSLRSVVPIDVEPYDVAAVPASMYSFNDQFDSPVPLVKNEALDFYYTDTVAQIDYGAIWLSDGPTTPIAAPAYTIKTTATATLVVNVWNLVSMTWPTTLPAGKYQIIGASFRSVTSVVGRLVIPGYAWRPGAIAASIVANNYPDHFRFRWGNAGVWGTFDSRQPPQAELLPTTADTAEAVFLDLVRLG
jgi:hypothetical protein